jgi:hypothetical protein
MNLEHAFLISVILSAIAVSPVAAKDNKPPRGFKAIFNGRDLEGWQGLVEIPQRERLTKEQFAEKQREANSKFLPHWSVRDGILHYDGKGKSLQTSQDYGNFELRVDWKIGPKGDTGIFLRGCPQVQIWDNSVGSGGLYNNKKNPRDPRKRADRPIGGWNTFRIVMIGDKVRVWLNKELVVDNITMENYWDYSKPVPAKGPIELQHHGNPLDFKNIYIKEIK